MTLSGLHQQFLRYCEVERRLAAQTILAYRSDFLQFLEFLFGQSRWGLVLQDNVKTFSVANVRNYLEYMAQCGWSPATVRRRLGELGLFAGWLVKRGFFAENPLVGIERPRRPQHLPKVLAWTDVERLVAGERRVRDRAILSLLAYGGLRRGEVVSLDVGDFSPTTTALRVRGKGNKDRVIPLPGPAVDALLASLATRPAVTAEAPLFVTNEGKRITAKVVRRVVAAAGVRLGRHVHPHVLRHSYATELLERGASIRDIRDLLGHQSVATTEIYTHVSTARKRQVVQLLEPAAEGGYGPSGYNPSSAGSN